ncbi:hypothetical protein [Gordonia amicalis]|uniref:hypothetical protein n=1 Tax=Gordonia amicalis TaxID=89053 RepID=UPI00387DCABB
MSNGALGRRLVSPDSPDAAEIIRLSTIVGERLAARSDELSESMTTAIENGLEELNDPDLLELLRASVAANIATILHMIRNNIARSGATGHRSDRVCRSVGTAGHPRVVAAAGIPLRFR